MASGGLAAFAVAALVVRRRRDLGRGRALARRCGLDLYTHKRGDLLARLRTAALMQIGHSRRVDEAFLAKGPTYLFPYVFETGFEHRRQSHRWLVVARDIDHPFGRVTFTQHDWFRIAASGAGSHEVALRPAEDPARGSDLIVVTEDLDAWNTTLKPKLLPWITQQPIERTWEILPGMVVGYQSGRLDEKAMADLAAAADALAQHLKSESQTAPGDQVPATRVAASSRGSG